MVTAAECQASFHRLAVASVASVVGSSDPMCDTVDCLVQLVEYFANDYLDSLAVLSVSRSLLVMSRSSQI